MGIRFEGNKSFMPLANCFLEYKSKSFCNRLSKTSAVNAGFKLMETAMDAVFFLRNSLPTV